MKSLLSVNFLAVIDPKRRISTICDICWLRLSGRYKGIKPHASCSGEGGGLSRVA